MRKALIATSALAVAGAMAAGPASAADMLSVGVGGYMEQWFGFANRDDAAADGGFDIQSDSEIYFQGSLESDAGMKFTVHVQLEANNEAHTEPSGDDTEIDESFARMSGAFGTIEIGQRDPIHARTHYAAAFGAGVGLNAGDTQKWIGGAYLETAGWLHDNLNVIYISPRTNGVQVGLSYGADAGSENSTASAPDNNDDSVWAAGINFNETVGDMSFKVSLGHLSRSRSTSLSWDMDNLASNNDTAGDMSYMMKGDNDQSFTNAGLSIGMGAFTFGVSYATRDDGILEPECWVGTANDRTDGDDAAVPCTMVNDDGNYAATADNPTTADVETDAAITGVLAVEDKSKQHDTFAVGIGYTDGPLSVSIGHMNRDAENGDERTATMVSAGYKLAPGVSWKTSIFGVEDDTSGKEGTAFVTGLDIDF